jgi:CheY-like chemotaxis protein
MQNYTVLYIEDNKINQIVIQRLLEGKPISVLLADTAKEGLETARENGTGIHLILLDIQLPDMNGFEVITELQADPVLSRIPVIALTGMNDDKSVYTTKGFSDLILKPVTSAKLTNILKQYRIISL